jgi:hypothetical protein
MAEIDWCRRIELRSNVSVSCGADVDMRHIRMVSFQTYLRHRAMLKYALVGEHRISSSRIKVGG